MQTDVVKPANGLALGNVRVSASDGLWVVGFAALLVVAAHLRFFVPGNPVPVTMQTAAVLLCGFCLRPRLAMAAVVLYIVAGIAAARLAPQLSLFAALKAGKLTATLGYLLGFVPAAGLVSVMSRQVRRVTLGRALAIGFFGTAVIFLFGVTWLALITDGLDTAIQIGLVPFVVWAAVKIALVASLVSTGVTRLGR